MYAVEVRDHIMIAHSFRGDVFGPAQALHGATFVVDVAFISDQLDKNGDGKVSQQEYIALAGPPDGPQAQGLPPFELRKKISLMKFGEIDTNKDGILDRVEVTAHAVNQFMQMDLNKDHYLNEEEFKKAQDAEQQKLRALVQTMAPAPAPAQPPRPAPAPAPSQSSSKSDDDKSKSSGKSDEKSKTDGKGDDKGDGKGDDKG